MHTNPAGSATSAWDEADRDFFFASRRRHPRCLSDWSSDVCSSDLMALICCRFNWRTTIPLAALTVAALLLLFGGRQTSLSASEGTGQDRIQLWSEALMLFREAPLDRKSVV